jgi:DNA-binding response OmpR family regulator
MSQSRPHHRPAVLVIDDAPAVSTTLVWVLKQNGYRCATAATRREALQLCAGFTPDLALIEMSLPDARGVDLARDLRRRVPGCRMFLMSSDPEIGGLQQARAGLDCDLLPKPIPVEELLRKLKQALAQPA